MEFLELCKERYSVRHYSSQPVEDEKIQKILEAGRIAPTAANLQPQKIFVLKSKEALEKARSATRMMYDAPMALLFCYDDTISWKGTAFGDPDYDGGEADCAIIATMMMMEATELGLGTLYVRGYCAKTVSETFDLPENIHPACFLLIGYPSENSKPIPRHYSRKVMEETVVEL